MTVAKEGGPFLAVGVAILWLVCVDLFPPPYTRILVQPGDVTNAGETVVARWTP